ncbi:MAG: sugar MFS transporter [Desulfovibrio sp.]|nr:sugar MFS transporter [Desulfovibrio sp.]
MAETRADGIPAGTMAPMIPIFFCFFSMGFVDLCGLGSNLLKEELHLTDSQANLFVTLTFLWFFVFSVPVGLLMNKIGRKNTVILSMVITCIAMAAPMFTSSYVGMLVAFSLIGIGNVFLQTSLNPLVSNVIAPQHLASTLTFGQFVKAFVAILGPFVAAWCVAGIIPNFGLGWRAMFPVYGIVGVISTILIARVQIQEKQADKISGFGEVVRLLGDGFVLCCFIAIICHVGIDVGTNATAPRFLAEVWPGQAQDAYNFAIVVYFIARTTSCLLGAGLLRVMPAKPFFLCGVALVGAGIILLWSAPGKMMVYISVVLIALGNSNLFSVAFSQALSRRPSEGNEVAGLMIMGVCGGAIIPQAMGIASDVMQSQAGAVLVLCAACIFLLCYSFMIRSLNVAK